MAINVPRRNLGGEAEPWGRSVDERLLRQQGAIDLLQTDVKNSFKGINASISGLSRTVGEIRDMQVQLAAQQEALEEQQGELEQQQTKLAQQTSALATQTTKLSNTIVGLPKHTIKSDSRASTSITTSEQTVLSTTLTIPSAHDYAWITGYIGGNMYANSNPTGTLYVKFSVTLAGNTASTTEAFYLPEGRFRALNLNYQTAGGFSTSSSRSITVRVSVWKSVSGDSFASSSLAVAASALSYKS